MTTVNFNGPVFGAATTTSSTTNPFAFGAATNTAAPMFAGFGATSNPAASTFNFTPTNPAVTTSAPAFNSTGFRPVFGATNTATTSAPTMNIFGLNVTASTTQPTLGVGGFNTTATTNPPTFGGFGPTVNTTMATFPFGGAQPQPTSQPFAGFPSLQPQPQSQFPGQIQQLQQQAYNRDDILITSLTTPHLFSDERDDLILKWNILQVFYGTGKTFCHQGAYEVDDKSVYHAFNTYSYSVRPRTRDEDGLVSLIINQKLADVARVKDKFIENLHRLFNNNPNCLIELEGLSALAEDKTQMLIVVRLKQPGSLLTKKVKASDVVNHLSPPQPTQSLSTLLTNNAKQHLESMGIVQIFARTDLTDQEYKQYLDSTPAGLTSFIWEQAKKENPKPQMLLPVALIGVKALRDRMKQQAIEYDAQKQELVSIRQQIQSVKDQCETFRLQMKRYQTNLLEYSHRILKATIQFEIRRRLHEPKLTSNEIKLWTSISPLISYSSQYSSKTLDIRIKDLLMQIRMNPQILKTINWTSLATSSLDNEKLETIKDILHEIHRGIKNILEIVQNDRQTLLKIDEQLPK
ncbi:unnamed protein product [Didymodactylos carnosus]|uniref:Nucleoporin Nup54 alpha-helical domain-containing protein n=1 Tax=Didymodactylos carnosus TaxID=1234261 RepID=A0A813ZSD1_9BILA|nr:unnamed protein product [Didymodactylos carnosus]CAF0903241.1 unnamed protein product [Didymodactylos carnosus]CAF3638559.1 unnamed protein product [Didymodactylos carnosus]CAF3685432.1 unnamed protein product [Didymodactylos carnosus]